jgi:hypothetical protein
MWKWFKRLFSIALVLATVALVLNLKIAGRPARDLAWNFWQSEGVQKVYRVVKDRVMALIRKDISVEEVFKPELPKPQSSAPGSVAAQPQAAPPPPEQTKVIELEKLDEADRKALEEILKKSSK